MRFTTPAAFATIAVLAALMTSVPVHAQNVQLLANPGLNDPYTILPVPTGKAKVTGAVASGWVDDSSWADVTAVYAKVKVGAHGGGAAQSITVKSVRTGNVQLAQWLTLKPHHSYALGIWLKGKPGAKATVALRLAPSPYTMLGLTTVTLTGAWQHVQVAAAAHEATKGGVMIYPPTGSTLLIDDASLAEVTKRPV